MKLKELLEVVHKAYPDGQTQAYTHGEKFEYDPEGGDLLAAHIVAEIVETFDPEASSWEQCNEAERVMDASIDELIEVSKAIAERGRQVLNSE